MLPIKKHSAFEYTATHFALSFPVVSNGHRPSNQTPLHQIFHLEQSVSGACGIFTVLLLSYTSEGLYPFACLSLPHCLIFLHPRLLNFISNTMIITLKTHTKAKEITRQLYTDHDLAQQTNPGFSNTKNNLNLIMSKCCREIPYWFHTIQNTYNNYQYFKALTESHQQTQLLSPKLKDFILIIMCNDHQRQSGFELTLL